MNKEADYRRALSPTGTPLHPLEKRVYQRLKKLRPYLEGQVIIVAVSGGLDSVTLLKVLQALSPRFNWKLRVAHVNHAVRGRASDLDSKFVADLARELKIPQFQRKLTGMENKDVGENLLRQKRYEILFQLKKKLGAPYIVTAHHKDDLLETRLMRLLQGTGIHGLQAMTLSNEQGVLRPFLDVSRREIEAYAKRQSLQWRNDATNKDTTKLRNWLRRNWLGQLAHDYPQYLENLFKSLDKLVAENRTEPEEVSKIFDRRILTSEMAQVVDFKIFNYLRYFAKKRVTSRHVLEFKKRLSSPRKNFEFRLAGRDWKVESNSVMPWPSPVLSLKAR